MKEAATDTRDSIINQPGLCLGFSTASLFTEKDFVSLKKNQRHEQLIKKLFAVPSVDILQRGIMDSSSSNTGVSSAEGD